MVADVSDGEVSPKERDCRLCCILSVAWGAEAAQCLSQENETHSYMLVMAYRHQVCKPRNLLTWLVSLHQADHDFCK